MTYVLFCCLLFAAEALPGGWSDVEQTDQYGAEIDADYRERLYGATDFGVIRARQHSNEALSWPKEDGRPRIVEWQTQVVAGTMWKITVAFQTLRNKPVF